METLEKNELIDLIGAKILIQAIKNVLEDDECLKYESDKLNTIKALVKGVD